MAGVRMTGLVSGMDTESIVKQLVESSSKKIDEAKQEKQLVEWEKEAWTDLNTKIVDFYKTSLSVFKTHGAYSSKSVVSNEPNLVTATAGINTNAGSHTVSVKQLAQSAYVTSGRIDSDKEYTTYKNISNSTKFSDFTDENGNLVDLYGKNITFYNDTDSLSLMIGEDINSIDELNKKLSGTDGFKDLQASVENGKLIFKNNSAKTTENANSDQDSLNITTGTVFRIESDAFNLNGQISYEPENNVLQSSNTYNYAQAFSGKSISSNTKLTDIGILEGTSFFVNDKEFIVDKDMTVDSFAKALQNTGINANFDDVQKRFFISSKSSGADYAFDITSSDNNALEILGLGSTATKIDAQDSIFEYNGVEYTSNTNKISLNGLNIEAKGVTTNPVTLNIQNDTETIYKNIKDFVNSYNALIDEMYKLYNEEKTDYKPLTEEERNQISDKEAEQWEEKAKQGLLRRDSTISSLLSNMRSILNQRIEVANSDGSKSYYTLSSFGIVTGSYTEHGKLHIQGDEDDALYADQKNILKEKLNSQPEIFGSVFSGNKDNPGIGTKMYQYLTSAMKYKAGVSSTMTIYNNLSMDEDIKDWEERIKELTNKSLDLEDKYYKQFSAMEAAMARLQSQQSYIAQLMGGF